MEKHQNRNLYISDFNSVKEILDTKYGVRDIEKGWSNSLYKDNPENYGMALAVGHYRIWTTRENDKSSAYTVL